MGASGEIEKFPSIDWSLPQLKWEGTVLIDWIYPSGLWRISITSIHACPAERGVILSNISFLQKKLFSVCKFLCLQFNDKVTSKKAGLSFLPCLSFPIIIYALLIEFISKFYMIKNQ